MKKQIEQLQAQLEKANQTEDKPKEDKPKVDQEDMPNNKVIKPKSKTPTEEFREVVGEILEIT